MGAFGFCGDRWHDGGIRPAIPPHVLVVRVYNCHWVSAHFASADRMPNVCLGCKQRVLYH